MLKDYVLVCKLPALRSRLAGPIEITSQRTNVRDEERDFCQLVPRVGSPPILIPGHTCRDEAFCFCPITAVPRVCIPARLGRGFFLRILPQTSLATFLRRLSVRNCWWLCGFAVTERENVLPATMQELWR